MYISKTTTEVVEIVTMLFLLCNQKKKGEIIKIKIIIGKNKKFQFEATKLAHKKYIKWLSTFNKLQMLLLFYRLNILFYLFIHYFKINF